MAERPDQIEKHIASTRSELGNNLQELEHKVKQAADWRTYYERNPMTMVAVAFGGGVLLASLIGGKNRDSERAENPMGKQAQRPKALRSGMQSGPLNETWNTLKAAIIALAGMKLRTVLDEALPGFSEQYDKATREHGAYSPSSHIQREYETSAHRM